MHQIHDPVCPSESKLKELWVIIHTDVYPRPPPTGNLGRGGGGGTPYSGLLDEAPPKRFVNVLTIYRRVRKFVLGLR